MHVTNITALTTNGGYMAHKPYKGPDPTGKQLRVKVTKGSSYWRIAQKAYGNGRYWGDIKRFNADRGTIHPGDELTLPIINGVAPSWTDQQPVNKQTIMPGMGGGQIWMALLLIVGAIMLFTSQGLWRVVGGVLVAGAAYHMWA